MKHRSIIAFILLAAALFAAPQVSHDLAALKSELGARIRGEILHAFLNLHANDAAPAPAARRAETLLASCKAEARPDAPAASDAQTAAARARHTDERAHAATQSEVATQGDAGTQLAMLISPSLTFEDSSAEATGVDDKFILGGSDEFLHRASPSGDLAMLVPPDMGLDARELSGVAGGVDARETRARDERHRSVESRRREVSPEMRFETAAAKFEGTEALRNLNSLLRDAVWVRATQEGTKIRVLKLRLQARARGAKAPAAVPPSAPDASDKSLPAMPVWLQTSAGE